MNANTQAAVVTDNSQPTVADSYKDLVKNSIALPLEACKGMATGCVTVAGIYGATVAFLNAGHPPRPDQWQIYAILFPFILLALSEMRFATAYLPDVRLTAARNYNFVR
jgi:hypothetical protein